MLLTPAGVGDLSLLGWAVFLAYFAVAALCYRAAALCWREGDPSRRLCWFWVSLAGILVLLGVNKQLDLQVWLNAFGRQLAESEGWYPNRRLAQVTFFAGFSAVVVSGGLWMLWLAHSQLRRVLGVLLGMMALGTFLLLRAISFDVVDLRTYLWGIKLHEILEMLGICLIGVAAVVFSREPD